WCFAFGTLNTPLMLASFRHSCGHCEIDVCEITNKQPTRIHAWLGALISQLLFAALSLASRRSVGSHLRCALSPVPSPVAHTVLSCPSSRTTRLPLCRDVSICCRPFANQLAQVDQS